MTLLNLRGLGNVAKANSKQDASVAVASQAHQHIGQRDSSSRIDIAEKLYMAKIIFQVQGVTDTRTGQQQDLVTINNAVVRHLPIIRHSATICDTPSTNRLKPHYLEFIR